MEFVMQSGGVPVGSYRAKFIRTEPYTDNQDKYGPGLALKFEVLEGEHAGTEATRICSQTLSPKSALGELAVAIKGADIAQGERFSFLSYVGVTGSIIVEPTKNGGTRVAAFIRDTAPQQSAQPVQQQAQPATGNTEQPAF